MNKEVMQFDFISYQNSKGSTIHREQDKSVTKGIVFNEGGVEIKNPFGYYGKAGARTYVYYKIHDYELDIKLLHDVKHVQLSSKYKIEVNKIRVEKNCIIIEPSKIFTYR